MIGIDAARGLLNFGARIDSERQAQQQLHGAVAIHNTLEEHGVAYLADEVGMGKTYVALGALALFRHYKPDFRVLIMAPRENIQQKWIKEMGNFVANNVRFPDLRVKSLDGRPVRQLVKCDNLLQLVKETTLDPDRDFFVRFTSYSLPLGRDVDSWRVKRDQLKAMLPWLPNELFYLRDKQLFKDNFARAICCALPSFDLVIVDEGHNLKHGYSEHVSARNRVLALTLGRDESVDRKMLSGYRPRAAKVLFLSATPIEETYIHLWNQLNVFGLAKRFDYLRRTDVDEDSKKRTAGQFLVRRVTGIRHAGQELTKNLYRREWRRGGVEEHDKPITVEDQRQRLVVALIQKKVSELLGHERFNSSFQIGMLASFESFLETSKLKRSDDDETIFDDSAQADTDLEKEGIDVREVNRLARDFRRKHGEELPHPKMDALVGQLVDSWSSGRKSLVFVRRIASVKELKRKLDDSYDAWLISRLRKELPAEVLRDLNQAYETYKRRQLEARDTDADLATPDDAEGRRERTASMDDRGGIDTFFAWFFRGDGPSGMVSGARIKKRLDGVSGALSTFFDRNHVMDLTGQRPGGVFEAAARSIGVRPTILGERLRNRARLFASKKKRWDRAVCFAAAQAAMIEILATEPGPLQERARIMWHERYKFAFHTQPAGEAPDMAEWLELPTFWTEIQLREDLRQSLWPEPETDDFRIAFREQEQRAQLIASAARLGHAFIDLYAMTIRRLGSLSPRVQERSEQEGDQGPSAIDEYLDLLEKQMRSVHADRPWSSFDELSAIARQFHLILDVNDPEARTAPLAETARRFGSLLRQQQPAGGMSGQVNQTLVRQFRMPGYPLVLVSTDLLKEGEDLHTFCSSVYHYGISWTPSSMEQRVGRVDRIQSQTERRLTRMQAPMTGEDMLQVYYPHLEDTVELLQVRRVLERVNEFLRLMHEGLTVGPREPNKIDVARELISQPRPVEQIRTKLQSAFPIEPRLLDGRDSLAIGSDFSEAAEARFSKLRAISPRSCKIDWEETAPVGALIGTIWLDDRQQPFVLQLRSCDERLMVHCMSPIGNVEPEEHSDRIIEASRTLPARLGALLTKVDTTYDLTVEGDVLLAGEELDGDRVSALVWRVCQQADLFEQELQPGEDKPISMFEKDLGREGERDE